MKGGEGWFLVVLSITVCMPDIYIDRVKGDGFFSFRQVCKAPKEGHYCAKARAPLCSDKSTIVPPRSAMVHKSDTTRKSEAQISIFQRYESQTSL